MPHKTKSEAEAMQELASLMWTRFFRERVREELNHEMNGYKAEVVTNNGDGTLTVKRPFETTTLTLKAASSLGNCEPGDMVIVVGIGDKTTALSNAFILCKTDLSNFEPPYNPSNAIPQMDGIGVPGTSLAWSRGDHVHPSDTSKQDNLNLSIVNGKLCVTYEGS